MFLSHTGLRPQVSLRDFVVSLFLSSSRVKYGCHFEGAPAASRLSFNMPHIALYDPYIVGIRWHIMLCSGTHSARYLHAALWMFFQRLKILWFRFNHRFMQVPCSAFSLPFSIYWNLSQSSDYILVTKWTMNSSYPSIKILSVSPQVLSFQGCINFTKLQSMWWHHHLTLPAKPQVPTPPRKPANGPWHVRCSNGWVNYIGCITLRLSLVTAFPTKQWIKALCKMNVGLKMNPSLPSIHQFWRFFSAPPQSSLQHSRHLPKLLVVFLPRWMTWRTRKRVNLHSKSMGFAYQHGIWKNLLLFEKDVMIFQLPNLQFLCGVSPFAGVYLLGDILINM